MSISRHERLRRWLTTIYLLQLKGEIHISDLAKRFEREIRTIRRDMEEMEGAIPGVAFPLKNNICKIEGKFKIPVKDSLPAKMLHLLMQSLLPFSAEFCLEQLGAIVGDVDPEGLLAVHVPQGFVVQDVLFTVLEATIEKFVLQMDYVKAYSSEPETRIILPQKLFFRKQGWYVVAWDYQRQAHRIFRMNRIKKIWRYGKSEELPKQDIVPPVQLLNDSFGVHVGEPQTVKLLFSAWEGPYIEEVNWHKSQKFHRLDNGELEMELFVAPDYDLVQWILGFGSDVEVLEPDSLVRDVSGDLQAALNKYKSRSVGLKE
jgi:predicted DNA-binding transcriptional regulator YafY